MQSSKVEILSVDGRSRLMRINLDSFSQISIGAIWVCQHETGILNLFRVYVAPYSSTLSPIKVKDKLIYLP
jgi:hypothetical protein